MDYWCPVDFDCRPSFLDDGCVFHSIELHFFPECCHQVTTNYCGRHEVPSWTGGGVWYGYTSMLDRKG
eukprot:scaffold31309_cov37-Attheya_sp.AAC.1